MMHIELARELFEKQPNRIPLDYQRKPDEGHSIFSYSVLKQCDPFFKYACYFDKKDKQNTPKAFSFVCGDYLYASNLEDINGRRTFALRVRLGDAAPQLMDQENDKKTTPVFKVIACTLCMYLHEVKGVNVDNIPQQICNFILGMSQDAQESILKQKVSNNISTTELTLNKVERHLFQTLHMKKILNM